MHFKHVTIRVKSNFEGYKSIWYLAYTHHTSNNNVLLFNKIYYSPSHVNSS